jgi:hypothetical protein
MFSTTTTASSMTRPMATASPPIDIRLMDPPNTRRNRNVGTTASGSVTAAMMVSRTSRRKAIRTTMARTPPMRIASRTLAIDSATNSARSYTLVMRNPAGSVRVKVVSAASTPCFNVRMLAPICCEMLIDTASRPLPVMSIVRSGAPGTTAPTSLTRIAAPFFSRTGAAAMSSTLFQRPDASARCCWPASA